MRELVRVYRYFQHCCYIFPIESYETTLKLAADWLNLADGLSPEKGTQDTR
jgi:hypothetical protein